MEYREHRPPAALVPWVRCFWELEDPGHEPPGDGGAAEAPVCEPVLPDGCAELVFHFGSPFGERGEDGGLRRQGPRLFAGAGTRAVWLVPALGADVLGVRFEPGGAALLGRPELWRWRDAIQPLEVLEDERLERLAQRMGELVARGSPRSPGSGAREVRAQRRAALAQELLRRLTHARPSPVLRAARVLLADPPAVGRVAASSGLSARQLERRFLAEVGLGPKELARVGRFQRAVQRLFAAPQATLTAIAHASGYADHAHFTREFRALAGLPPSRFREGPHALAQALSAGAS